MNYRKLAAFALAFGIFFVSIGVLKLLCNLPLSEQRSQLSGNSIAAMNAWVSGMGGAMQIRDENELRGYKRSDAFKMIVFGGIVIFAAVAVRKSVNKPKLDAVEPFNR